MENLRHLLLIVGLYWLVVGAFCWLADRIKNETLFILACGLTLFAYGVLSYLCF